jgi:drug/metabolite transporter (DMT)-like permease
MQIIGSFFVLPFAIPNVSRLFVHPWAALGGILLGVVNAFGTLSLYKGFEVGRLSVVSPIASSSPVVSVILAVVFLEETITEGLLLGIILVITGIILVCIQTTQNDGSKQVLKGAAYATGFMFLGGLLFFGLKPVSSALGVFLPVLIIRWTSIPIIAAPILAQGTRSSRLEAFRLILAVAFLDTFANVAYNLGVSFGTVTIVSTLGGMFSAVTVLFARIILKEKLTAHQILGFVTIVLGVGILGYLSG